MLDSGTENYTSSLDMHFGPQAQRQPQGSVVPSQINFNQKMRGSIEGKAAVVQYDKTPFIVLSDGGR